MMPHILKLQKMGVLSVPELFKEGTIYPVLCRWPRTNAAA
jgi:hypothetical protein